MGLREKVTLIAIAVILQAVYIYSKPQSLKNPFERYSSNQKNKKTTPSNIFNKPKHTENSYANREDFTSPSNFQTHNFPDIESPYDTSYNDPFVFNPVSNNQKLKSSELSVLLENFKKEARKKRKSNAQTNKDMVQQPALFNIEQSTKPFYMTEIGGFPEVEYPLSAMDAWTPKYWNPLPSFDDPYIKTDENLYQSQMNTKRMNTNSFIELSGKKGIKSMFPDVKKPRENKNKITITECSEDKNNNIIEPSKITEQVKKDKDSLSTTMNSNSFTSATSQNENKSNKRVNTPVLQRKQNLNNKVRSKSEKLRSQSKLVATDIQNTSINKTAETHTVNNTDISKLNTFNNSSFEIASTSDDYPSDAVCESPNVVSSTELSKITHESTEFIENKNTIPDSIQPSVRSEMLQVIPKTSTSSYTNISTENLLDDTEANSDTTPEFNLESLNSNYENQSNSKISNSIELLQSQLATLSSSELREVAEIILTQICSMPKYHKLLEYLLDNNNNKKILPTEAIQAPIIVEPNKTGHTNDTYYNPLPIEYFILPDFHPKDNLKEEISNSQDKLPPEFVVPKNIVLDNEDPFAIEVDDVTKTISSGKLDEVSTSSKVANLNSVPFDHNSHTPNDEKLSNYIGSSLSPRIISDLFALNILVQSIIDQIDIQTKSNLCDVYSNKVTTDTSPCSSKEIIFDSEKLFGKLVAMPKDYIDFDSVETRYGLNDESSIEFLEKFENNRILNNIETSIIEINPYEITFTIVPNLSTNPNEPLYKKENSPTVTEIIIDKTPIEESNKNYSPLSELYCPLPSIDQCSVFEHPKLNLSNTTLINNSPEIIVPEITPNMYDKMILNPTEETVIPNTSDTDETSPIFDSKLNPAHNSEIIQTQNADLISHNLSDTNLSYFPNDTITHCHSDTTSNIQDTNSNANIFECDDSPKVDIVANMSDDNINNITSSQDKSDAHNLLDKVATDFVDTMLDIDKSSERTNDGELTTIPNSVKLSYIFDTGELPQKSDLAALPHMTDLDSFPENPNIFPSSDECSTIDSSDVSETDLYPKTTYLDKSPKSLSNSDNLIEKSVIDIPTQHEIESFEGTSDADGMLHGTNISEISQHNRQSDSVMSPDAPSMETLADILDTNKTSTDTDPDTLPVKDFDTLLNLPDIDVLQDK